MILAFALALLLAPADAPPRDPACDGAPPACLDAIRRASTGFELALRYRDDRIAELEAELAARTSTAGRAAFLPTPDHRSCDSGYRFETVVLGTTAGLLVGGLVTLIALTSSHR